MNAQQYDIVLVNLDSTIGSEIRKTRPCVIISPNEMNNYLKTVVIVPLTSTLNKYPTRVLVHHNGQDGMAAIDQIRTIDKSRIIQSVGVLSRGEISKIKAVLQEAFVD